MALRSLLVLSLAACLAQGGSTATSELRHAHCRSALAALRTRSTFEVAALCRATLPADICKQATRHLGPAPWSEESMHSACSRWESEWAPSARSKTRFLESTTEEKDLEGAMEGDGRGLTSVDNATGSKCFTDSPWAAPAAGINAFTIPIIDLASASKETVLKEPFPKVPRPENTLLEESAKFNISEAAKQCIKNGVEKLPKSLPEKAVVGSITVGVNDIVTIPHDLGFQQAISSQVAELAGVNASQMTVTAVQLIPKLDDLGVAKVNGDVQAYFLISGGNASEVNKIAKRLKTSGTHVLQYRIWKDMTARGSNQHSLLVESLDVRAGGAEEEDTEGAAKALKAMAAEASKKGEEILNATKSNASKKVKEILDATKSNVSDKAEEILNATQSNASKQVKEQAEKIASAAAQKASESADHLAAAVKGFKGLLGKKEEKEAEAKAGDVVDDAEVHQGGAVAKDGAMPTTAARASATFAAAALCAMAALMAAKLLRRRRAASQRSVAPRGASWAGDETPRLRAIDGDECEGLE